MNNVKPFKIVIEWSGTEDFYFSCDYRNPALDTLSKNNQTHATRTLPVMTKAMGNVFKKLRKEHISFPMFTLDRWSRYYCINHVLQNKSCKSCY